MENPTGVTAGAQAAGTAAFPWMALLPIAQTLYGGFQSIRANQKLKKLRNENIEYKATPETKNILGVAAANARHGFTEAQKAAVFQNFAAQTAKSYRMGMARAGNSLSNAIGASNDIANSNNFNNWSFFCNFLFFLDRFRIFFLSISH